MTVALLVAALSVPGVALTWRLLRPLPPLPWELPVDHSEPEGVRFGFDSRGLVG